MPKVRLTACFVFCRENDLEEIAAEQGLQLGTTEKAEPVVKKDKKKKKKAKDDDDWLVGTSTWRYLALTDHYSHSSVVSICNRDIASVRQSESRGRAIHHWNKKRNCLP